MPSPLSLRRRLSRTRLLLLAARFVSGLFSPLYLTVYAAALVLTLSHMAYLPVGFRLMLLGVVWFFAVLLPRALTRISLRFSGLAATARSDKQRRILSFGTTLMSYAAMAYLFAHLQTPHIIGILPYVAGGVIVSCGIVNVFYKASAYAAGAGGAVGLLMGLSLVYAFEASGWICLAVLLCGLVSSARVALRCHTLGETAAGAATGFTAALFCSLWC
ncbi:MAG: hypothetical protein IJS89_07365 [Bacteroidaceae bacterium]|nr:hypothetical protein [Bacteroidaceae bacterium]